MKKIILLLSVTLAAACGKSAIDTEKIASLASEQCRIMKQVLPEGTMPRTFENGKLVTSDLRWWCAGFYPGICWYTCKLGGDTKELALNQTERLMNVEKLSQDHDIGFQVMPSVAHAYRETGDSKYLPVLEEGATRLAARFSPVVGATMSWNWEGRFPVIVDNMVNLELLTYASKLFDRPEWKDIAVTHAWTTLRNHFRDDYSCYHLVDFDPADGSVKEKITHQGYTNDSAWSRGQSWALYGFTMMYRETGVPEFLEQAENVASFLLSKLKDRPIPNWDYDAPQQADDASSAAIMASAFLELSQYATDRKTSDMYWNQAEVILRELSSDKYLCKEGECAGFLLKHSVGHYAIGNEVDVPLLYADYYFLEALYRWKTLRSR
ncbi:MAG: glucuronyl hydrolase [Bacteroidales bacterium]|nr:glucuronyl hydrolase [Bacteroidales bacterium]